ncbi:MAG: hypothetical protein IJF07_03150, partial [Lachnospiraceae bacterium]|nr:hypothetical protein [Lachnospiraceae bacterium]
FDTTIGYYLSLSRLFSFLPYFILGYYIKKKETLTFSRPKHLLALLVMIVSVLFLWKTPQITSQVLYGSYSYHGADYNICTKLLLMLIAYAYIYFIFNLPNINHKIPIITTLGQNTLSIFLLHGFIIKALAKTNLLSLYPKYNLLIVILLTIVILILLGNTFVANKFSKLFTRNRIFFCGNQAINNKKNS